MRDHENRKKVGREAKRANNGRRAKQVCDGDDLAPPVYADDDWFDEAEGGLDEPEWVSSGVRAQRARQRLERYLDKRKVRASISEVFDEDFDDDWIPPGRGQRRERTRRKSPLGRS
ncbi:MAG: hypothetical protein GTO67_13860 [Gammaproteobacteria bacterium]|nr:hypothetical protein [Gammaproteobacteria bacterium]NIN39654.1 hypothetical protein [Gammaproteobacteria bacterium]NIO25211.1 hypothetical protein [Gammaproteobacteria bacterium]NIO65840.1 hypothetical protein [Gammaproteobacteria bacterium]NIP64729.1 hypothetical protein [Gammaproteobacteria bacterium]